MLNELIIVRGGGDIATGTIYKLYKCGFSVLVLESEHPSAIRRNVAFSEAVYEGTQKVEDVICYFAKDMDEAENFLKEGRLTMVVDPDAKSVERFHPFALVDAILAKRNIGTTRDMAPLTVGLGPGFTGGEDVDVAIETMRGHNLGRLIYHGSPLADTKTPGNIGGYTSERVIRANAEGILRNCAKITDTVQKGQVIATIETLQGESVEVFATIPGLLRGLIRDGYPVWNGFKIADIDPRSGEYENCFTISDKARCIAGGVLEAVMAEYSRAKCKNNSVE